MNAPKMPPSPFAGVLLTVDSGVVHPVTDCMWVQAAPCGDTCGFADAAVTDEVTLTHDQAKLRLGDEDPRRVALDDAFGFTMRLLTRAEFRALPAAGKCAHDPKWGVPPIPVPDGYEWAVRDRKQKTKHLAPAEGVIRDDHWPKVDRLPLCDKGGRAKWTARKLAYSSVMECFGCVRAAFEEAGAEVPGPYRLPARKPAPGQAVLL